MYTHILLGKLIRSLYNLNYTKKEYYCKYNFFKKRQKRAKKVRHKLIKKSKDQANSKLL